MKIPRSVVCYVCIFVLNFVGALSLAQNALSSEKRGPFPWPDGKHFALSLTFDDARLSQIDVGLSLLDQLGVKVTFFVLPGGPPPAGIDKRLEGWKRAVASGHEIGNHSLTHPCANNTFKGGGAGLDNMSLQDMKDQFTESNKKITELLGVTPEIFAYPCGDMAVGRGIDTRSYVPVVAEHFLAGRTFNFDKMENDPYTVDLAKVTGMVMDEKDFQSLQKLVDQAAKDGGWLVLVGHEIGASGFQTTRIAALEQLVRYARDGRNNAWIVPMGVATKYIATHR